MNKTLRHLLDEMERLPDTSVPGGLCFDVRGPFRASMTFAAREGASLQQSAVAAADGLEVRVPQPEAPEPVSADEAASRLHALLARHVDTARASDADVHAVARSMVDSATRGSADEPLACAPIPHDAGEGLVVLGAAHTWPVWLHADSSLSFLNRGVGAS